MKALCRCGCFMLFLKMMLPPKSSMIHGMKGNHPYVVKFRILYKQKHLKGCQGSNVFCGGNSVRMSSSSNGEMPSTDQFNKITVFAPVRKPSLKS